MQLPDINIWLALAFESHVHHKAARDWFDRAAADSCAFCRLTQLGFLRLATNQKVFGKETVSMSGAWKLFDAFLSDERVTFANDPAGLDRQWRTFTSNEQFSPKVWNDAYLAAFAIVDNMRLVSCDGGFSQYQELNYIEL